MTGRAHDLVVAVAVTAGMAALITIGIAAYLGRPTL